ncbi:hypothetical protein F4680DRAFT_409276 [Xylaria scruposa]|nr:hypothetical protein F4680DRAFT_409276 [Xylaria scruposa]
MGTTGLDIQSGGKPVGLLKGSRASIFGEGDRASAPDQTSKKGQHYCDLVEDKKPIETYRKRSREEDHDPDDAVVYTEGESRLAKKSRLEAAEAVRVTDELVSEKAMQDFDSANEAQYPLEFDNVLHYYGDSEPENESAGEYDEPPTANGDGVAAPYNSEADDEEIEIEIHDDGEDAEVSDEPRENTEQEAEEISRMYDEVQYAGTDDGGEDHANDDREISATAARIHYESQRGVALAQDSQAALIDGVRAREAYICAQAKKIREREEIEDALEDEEMIDRQAAFFGLDGSMD